MILIVSAPYAGDTRIFVSAGILTHSVTLDEYMNQITMILFNRH